MSAAGYSLEMDANGIAVVGFDLPGKVNVMNDDFMSVMPQILDRLEANRADIRGVIITSHKPTFFAGGDLALMLRLKRGEEQFVFEHFERLKSYFRRLEKLKLPLVAAINGTALGGGYELCLACHRRIALRNDKTRIGLPEVNFGILPAAGGVIRLTSVLGISRALEFLVSGKVVDVEAALKEGLIHEIADTVEEMMAKSKDWIRANPGAVHPWDQARDLGAHRLPGKERAEVFSIAPRLQRMTGRSNKAAIKIADIAAESLYLDFDTASRIETRGFVELVVSDDAHQKISAFFDANNRRRAS